MLFDTLLKVSPFEEEKKKEEEEKKKAEKEKEVIANGILFYALAFDPEFQRF